MNLKDDSFDYFPEYNTQTFAEKKVPMPVWFVVTYKESQENYLRATETVHRALNATPYNNIKKYGRNILFEVTMQCKLLQEHRPPEHSNLSSVLPRRPFSSVKRGDLLKSLA